jgi:hypothetical protein
VAKEKKPVSTVNGFFVMLPNQPLNSAMAKITIAMALSMKISNQNLVEVHVDLVSLIVRMVNGVDALVLNQNPKFATEKTMIAMALLMTLSNEVVVLPAVKEKRSVSVVIG